jgi:glycosyltransferase involved in cell wall biosynthesis
LRILVWHVHGSWMTAFVQGDHEYFVPVLPGRGPDGRGRAQTWDWPASVREVEPSRLRELDLDVVVLQRPEELELTWRWTGRRAGIDLPAVYVEHNTPAGPAPATRHPLADGITGAAGAAGADFTIAHVTHFNQLMWDCGTTRTTVIEHGVVDPGYRYTGERQSLAVVVNEPVRRWRVAGTDLVLQMARSAALDVYGMGMTALAERAPQLTGHLHENLQQQHLHAELGRHRAYFHPYRWTSLGLSLIEAMTAGLPVLALATTEASRAIPAGAGTVSNDLTELIATAHDWLADPTQAREAGLVARQHALQRYGLNRYLDDWSALLKEVAR